MSRISGRATTHSLLSCSSACVRTGLSDDERPCNRAARAVRISGGRRDISEKIKTSLSERVGPALNHLARGSASGDTVGNTQNSATSCEELLRNVTQARSTVLAIGMMVVHFQGKKIEGKRGRLRVVENLGCLGQKIESVRIIDTGAKQN